MATTDSATGPLQRQSFAAALILVGVLMIGASLFTPHLSPGRSAWSQQQALEYQAAAANLHQLSHDFAEASPGPQVEAVQDKLNQAKVEYRRLRTQLDAARSLTGRITTILRVAGVVLAIAGTAMALVPQRL